MRKTIMSVNEARAHIDKLRGSSLKISVNKGRKKIVHYDGEIAEIYPSVFTLKIANEKNLNVLSCSYSDYICGGVKLAKA